MEQPNRTQIVRFNLLAVLLGVACSFALERFVENWSASRLLSTAAFLITTINFFHGKVVALEDEEYIRALIHRQRFALCDFVLNVGIIIAFMFMALYLDNPEALLTANLAVRCIDVPLILIVMAISHEKTLLTAQRSWLIINICAVLLFLTAIVFLQPLTAHRLEVAMLFLAVVIGDIIADYWVNAPMYFSSAGDWGEMAALWDEAQGIDGDIYRRRIVVPNLLSAFPVEGSKVLELGCGNGCISRALAARGAAAVTAVDKSSIMLDTAAKYESQRVRYLTLDIESFRGPIEGGEFDLIIACFSIQDCSARSIDAPFQLIRENLARSGHAVVIYENHTAFADGVHVTTSRRPLDAKKYTGIGRRWILSWGPKLVYFGQADRWSNETSALAALTMQPARTFTTITRHWSTASYLKASVSQPKEAGKTIPCLELSAPVTVLRTTGDPPLPSVLRMYEKNPKFSMASFRHRDGSTNHGRVLLVLITGVSGSGKSRLADQLKNNHPRAAVLDLDDFYRDIDDSKLPIRRGKPNWESVDSFHMDVALEAVEAILGGNNISVPVYDMTTSRRIATRTINASNIDFLVVHGLFAFEVFTSSAQRTVRLLLKCPRVKTFWRRCYRDIDEQRRGIWGALKHSVLLSLRDRAYTASCERIADAVYRSDVSPSHLYEQVKKNLSNLPVDKAR